MNKHFNKTAEKSADVNTPEWLEQTRLSTLPSRSAPAACVNCQKSLKNESKFSQKNKVCAGCLRIYATIDAALNASVEQKIRAAQIKKFAANFDFGDK